MTVEARLLPDLTWQIRDTDHDWRPLLYATSILGTSPDGATTAYIWDGGDWCHRTNGALVQWDSLAARKGWSWRVLCWGVEL